MPSSPGSAVRTPPSERRARRRPVRFARGPFVIGEPAAVVEAGLTGSEPYRPDTIVDGGSTFGLTVRAASVRGLSKRWGAGPRQDDICLCRHEPTRTLIAAVADGVSGAARSDLAAALVVRNAVGAVSRQLDVGGELDWEEVFGHTAWALVEEHRRTSADSEAGVEEAAATLSTTLLVAAISAPEGDPSRVEMASVGDSPAFLLSEGCFHPLLGEHDFAAGLIGGAVQALPRGAREVRSACCTLERPSVLLLGTDGFSLPLAGGENEVGAVFARELARPPEIVDFARLLDFSRSTYDDDRSLVAVWPRIKP
jgi:Protein phosphatase 2C